MYVFLNPKNVKSAEASLPPEITWEFAQKEIAQAKGFAVGSSGMTKGGNLCRHERACVAECCCKNNRWQLDREILCSSTNFSCMVR